MKLTGIRAHVLITPHGRGVCGERTAVFCLWAGNWPPVFWAGTVAHTYYPFIPGVSVRNYSDEWLEAKAREEAEKKPFRGKEYNLYEATQKQRQMETAMRAQREKVKLLQEGKADKDDIINAKCKYQARHSLTNTQRAFSKSEANLPEQRERIYYDLKGRVAPSTAHTYKSGKLNRLKKIARKALKEYKSCRFIPIPGLCGWLTTI